MVDFIEAVGRRGLIKTITRGDILATLDKLGRTSREMVDTLVNKGVKGRRGSMSQCPINKFLAEQFPEIQIKTSSTAIGVINPYSYTQLVVILPSEVTHLIINFDSGSYPELEETPSTLQ